MRTSKLLVSFLGVVSLGVIACGSNNFPGEDGNVDPNGGTIAPPNSTTPPADAGVTTVPPGCDPTQTPSQNACVVIEALGIFVAPPAANAAVDAGEGVADGTRARPYTKLQDAIDAAKTQKKRVYACSGDYAEQLTLADGVSMFSGLDCTSWAPIATHASVKAPASPAVTASSITTPTRVEAFEFIAPDGTPDAPSSIALVAVGSNALTLAHSTLHAGKGANGADGVAAVQLANGSANGTNGIHQYVATASLPACSSQPETVNTCAGAPGFSGGNGGAGGWGGHWVVHTVPNGLSSVAQYQPPRLQQCAPGRPCVCGASLGGALTGTATTAQGGYFGGSAAPGARAGSSGIAGAAGTNGATGAASIALDGGLHFVSGDGQPGTNGEPGQGGGGGMGYAPSPYDSPYDNVEGTELIGSAGAGGGAGGCPALAGTAGKGGGASIALLVSDSPLTLDTCILQTSDAGNGGKGTAGSAPTGGGSPGIDYANVSGTAGGSGGAGGASGWSGSGAGGWSVGIVSHGAAPTMNASTTTTLGKAGLGVDAIAANGKTVPATAAGVGGATATF